MSLRATCPSCGCRGDIEVFFVEDDGKRLAARFAELDPALGRATLGYLRLFNPAKRSMNNARADRLVAELLELASAGSVCKDERSSIRKPASVDLWARGMEQVMLQRDRLSLPLENHNYLRAVVFGLAEQLEARAEQRAEEDRRAGRHRGTPSTRSSADPIAEATRYAAQMVAVGGWSAERAEEHVQQARRRAEQA